MIQSFKVHVTAFVDKNDLQELIDNLSPGWQICQSASNLQKTNNYRFEYCHCVEALNVDEAADIAITTAPFPYNGNKDIDLSVFVDKTQDVIPEKFIIAEAFNDAQTNVYVASQEDLLSIAQERVRGVCYKIINIDEALSMCDNDIISHQDLTDAYTLGAEHLIMASAGSFTTYSMLHDAEHPYQIALSAIERTVEEIYAFRSIEEANDFIRTHNKTESLILAKQIAKILNDTFYQNTASLTTEQQNNTSNMISAMLAEYSNTCLVEEDVRQSVQDMLESLGFRLSA